MEEVKVRERSADLLSGQAAECMEFPSEFEHSNSASLTAEELLEKFRNDVSRSSKLEAAQDLIEVVRCYRLDSSMINEIWKICKELCRESSAEEERNIGLELIINILDAQGEKAIGKLKFEIWHILKRDFAELFHLKIKILLLISDNGRRVKPFSVRKISVIFPCAWPYTVNVFRTTSRF